MLIRDVFEDYYRGTRHDPELTLRPSLSFTDDPDVASVYASSPGKDAYEAGARVTKAKFDLHNPVDLGGPIVSLYDSFGAVGIDPADHVPDVIKLVNGLCRLKNKGRPYHFKTRQSIEFVEHLARPLRILAQREDWSDFYQLLEDTFVDAYAICDTQTFTRLAKAGGFDGFKYIDSFDLGAKAATKLLGKTKADTHVTYRPFGNVTWGQ